MFTLSVAIQENLKGSKTPNCINSNIMLKSFGFYSLSVPSSKVSPVAEELLALGGYMEGKSVFFRVVALLGCPCSSEWLKPTYWLYSMG